MFPVCSPQRFEAPSVMYPLQMQCVSQPLQVFNPYAPVVYTSTAPSNVVLTNASPPRPPLCNQVFLSGNVQGVPQQLIPQRMVSPEQRFSPGAASPQVPPPSPYVNPQLPVPSFPLGVPVPSSQPNQSGQRLTSDANLSCHGNLNRGFPLPTTPYGYLDGTPQQSNCSSDTMLDGSKKEFMITRAEKVSLWRTFAAVFHNGKNTQLETTDNSLLAVFLGLPSHIRRAIRHQGGIGAFLKECPWFLQSGDNVVLVPCMEKLYTCQDDDIIESAEKEEVTEGENADDVPDTWEDLSISDIEEGGYFGDYVPSEPETSDGESNQKCESHTEDTKMSTEDLTGESFPAGYEGKKKLMEEEKKAQQLVSPGRMRQMEFHKKDREDHTDGWRKEKENISKRATDETGEIAKFVDDEDGKGRVWDGEGKCSEDQEETLREEKSPSFTIGVLSDCEGCHRDGNVGDGQKESLVSGNQSCQEVQVVASKDNCGDRFVSARDVLKEDTGGYLVDARRGSFVDSLADEQTSSPIEIWDDSDDPDSDDLKELFATVVLEDRYNHDDRNAGVSARAGSVTKVDDIGKGRKATKGSCKENQGEIQPPSIASQIGTTKDAGTSSRVEKKDKTIQTRDDNLKCNVQTDVSGLVVEDEKEMGKDVASQTLDWICQPEPKKIMVDCSVDCCDLIPVQKTVSINTEPVLQNTACVNTDPIEEKKECSDRCKKMVASCKSDLKKATVEQMDTEGRLCQTVSKLRQVERECLLLKEIHGSVVADLLKAKEKPLTEEKSTSADLNFNQDALKKLQKSLSEANVKLLHGNLKNVELQSKLALQLISQAYEESEIIFSMKKMSISKKADLTTQVMKYQRQLQSHKESVDEWKKKSDTFLMAGGIIEKLPLFPQIDIEKFTPEVSTKGPLRHPSQPSAGDFKLAANFTGQPATSAAPPYQTTSGMEATGRAVPVGGFNQSTVSPMSTFTPNKKSDRPGTGIAFDDKSIFNQKYAASVSELGKGNLGGNMGLQSSMNDRQKAVRNTEETMEGSATQWKNQSLPTDEPSQTLNSQDGDTRSTTHEKVCDTKQNITVGGGDVRGQKQSGSTEQSAVDSAVNDLKLEEFGPYPPSAADMYMYMQQAYASQMYEYPVDPYCWFDTPLDFYSGQFPVPPVSSFGSSLPGDYQSHNKEQMEMQGGDYRQGCKPSRDVGEGVAPSINYQNRDEQQMDLQGGDYRQSCKPSRDVGEDVAPSINYQNREQMDLQGGDYRQGCKPSRVVGEDVAPSINYQNRDKQQMDLQGGDYRQSCTPSRDVGEDVAPSIAIGGGDGQEVSPPITNPLPATIPVSRKPYTLEPTSAVVKNDAKQTVADKVTSPQFQKVSVDKTSICHPNQVKSEKRMAGPSLQANIGLDNFDSLSERSPRKKRVRGNQQGEMKRTGSGETLAEGKDSEGGWMHMAGKKKKRSHEQASQKRLQDPQVSKPSHPAEDEHIPNYFSLTHLLRKLSEMFPDESRLSLTSIILKVRANHRGQLDKVPFAVIISEAVSLLTATDSSEMSQNTTAAKKLEDSPEAVDQPATKSTQKGGLLTKLLKNLMEKFPTRERSDLIDGIVRVRNLHGNTLAGMTMAQVLFEVSQCLNNSGTGHKLTDKQNEEDKDCCTVCLAPLKATQLVRELECAHRFHDECIHLWFEKRERTCPVCRSHALLEDEFPRLH